MSPALRRAEISGTWDSLSRLGQLAREHQSFFTRARLHACRTTTLLWSALKRSAQLCAHREPRQRSVRHHPFPQGISDASENSASLCMSEKHKQEGRHLPQQEPPRRQIQGIKTFPLEKGNNMETHSWQCAEYGGPWNTQS